MLLRGFFGSGAKQANALPDQLIIGRNSFYSYTVFMIQINVPVPIRSAAAALRRGATGAAGTDFGAMLDAAGASHAESSLSARDVGGASVVGGLFALQEVSEKEDRRRKAMARGKSTLDSLEKLRMALLDGVLPQEVLHEIERYVEVERTASTDSGLNEILNEIELLAAVELAKIEMSKQKF